MYKIVYNNGFWKIRNEATFTDVAIYETYKAAVEDLARNT